MPGLTLILSIVQTHRLYICQEMNSTILILKVDVILLMTRDLFYGERIFPLGLQYSRYSACHF
jgi:hypothetical protein